MEWMVLYVMLLPTEGATYIRRVPVSRATCETLVRVGRLWPANECMPGNYKAGMPLPWETRYKETQSNICTPDADTDCG
jgi:hypothetical protein